MSHLDRSKRPIDPNILEKVRYSCSRTMGEKMLDGPRLFDLDCQLERIRIRAQFPTFNDEQVEQELRYRHAVARWNDEDGIYQDAGVLDSDELPVGVSD
ncbi:MAG: hypothetical protein NT013_29980 [Planctomycetia bacterium]|nr:hypothetical protein [Planctomycetia bacterium]